MTTAHHVQKVIEASLLRQQNADRQRDAACETAMVERTECDDAAASQEEEGAPSMSALIVSALAHAKAYFSVGASASTDLSVSVETVAAPAAAGSSSMQISYTGLYGANGHQTQACGRRVRGGYHSCANLVGKKKDHPSLAELQKLNESTVLLNQQGYSKLPVSVRKPDALTHQDTRRSTKAEYLNHVRKAWPTGVDSITVQL